MCTVSFLPNKGGFDLAMNRDEKLSRPAGLPPALSRCGGFEAIYPRELGGGAWIGVNEAGMAFALINWYSQPQREASLSRGTVIPALLVTGSAREAELVLKEMPLDRLNPFRLMVVSPAERCLQEWSSNGENLESSALPWERRHWFSSGFDEAEANRVRKLTCLCAAKEHDADSLPWLRRLHQSHYPNKGAFSICMHRADACTVSYAEISVNTLTATMAYHEGSPCAGGNSFSIRLPVKNLSRTV